MSKIHSKSDLESQFCTALSAILYKQGYRYRRNYKSLPGKPDVAFVKHRVVVFVDGDFWHGYKLKVLRKRVPRKYWLQKIEANISRDKWNNALIRRRGWTVVRIWEHDFKKNPAAAVEKVRKALDRFGNHRPQQNLEIGKRSGFG